MQGSSTVSEYITKFDNYYSYLPSWDEADKIDRFLAGLNSQWRVKATINPQTGKRWEEYYPMITFLVSLPSESTTGLLQREREQERPRNPRQEQRRDQDPRWQSRAQDRQRGARRRRNGMPSDPSKRKNMQNANNRKFWRTAGHMSYLITQKRGMCACCYGDGHNWADCTAEPVRSPPPGYNEFMQRHRQQQQQNDN